MNEEGRTPKQFPDAASSESIAKPTVTSDGKSARRRFLQTGLAGGSAALLASTHRAFAWNSGGSCTSPRTFSGYQSIQANPGTSAKPGTFTCGKSPGYWAPPGNPTKRLSSWPISSSTKFTDVFGSLYPAYGNSFGSTSTFYQIISTTPDTDARQFAAAYLDALSSLSFPESASAIVLYWQKNYMNSIKISAFISYLGTVET